VVRLARQPSARMEGRHGRTLDGNIQPSTIPANRKEGRSCKNTDFRSQERTGPQPHWNSDRALDLYWQKLNLTEMSWHNLRQYNRTTPCSGNDSPGTSWSLQNLSSFYPNNSGLPRPITTALYLNRNLNRNWNEINPSYRKRQENCLQGNKAGDQEAEPYIWW